MKNSISDILNSLFSSPSDKAGLLKGNGSISPKGSQPNGNTFGEVLAQLASQKAGDSNGSNPPAAPLSEGNGSPTSSLATGSQVEIKISEHFKVANLDQLAKAEQSLTSLAVGLSKLLGLLSNLQSIDLTQAQNTLVSLSGGTISPSDAKSLLTALKSMTQKLPDSQNPLLLPADQQNALLNQLLQQMVQNQQLQFGTSISPSAGGSIPGTPASSAGIQTNDTFLQMAFSGTQITQNQQTNTQSSQVFINLQTFQMAATFVQVGSNGNSGQNAISNPNSSNLTFQPISLPDTNSLLSALNQAFSAQPLNPPAITTPQPTSQIVSLNSATAQDSLNQNFKNLVQMLVQAGASQAVLTSILNQQKDLSGADLKQSLGQNVSMDSLLRSIAPNVLIPPVSQMESTAPSGNNTDNAQTSVAGKMFVQQMFTQASIATVEPQITPSGSLASPQTAQNIEAVSQGNIPIVDIHALNNLNDVVARLNVSAAQGTQADSTIVKQNISVEQLLNNFIGQPANSLNASLAKTQVSGAVPNPPSGAIQFPSTQSLATLINGSGVVPPQISVRELTAVNQVIQTQTIFNKTIDTLSNQAPVITVQQNNVDITSAARTQLIQTANVNPLENQVLPNLPANQVLPPPGITPNPLESIAPATGQTVIPSTFTVPITHNNQPTVVFNNPPEPAPTNNPSVINQPQPVSPVSITVQETVPPNPADVQVRVTDQIPVSTSSIAQVPAATTTATTVPVSTAQNVPASVVTGEAIKLAVQTQPILKNIDSNNLAASNTLSTVSEVKPVSPEAVSPVALGANVFTDLKATIDSSKNSNNNSINPQLILSTLINPANLTSEKNSTSSSSQANNNFSAPKIDSFQILNQVTDQITSHASEARAVSRLSFQLIPESLGRVTVQIALVDQAVSARIIVSNPDVRDSLQHHMVDLKTALNQAGLQIDQLQVQVQGGSSNLLAQYYQYQQEGFGYRLPASFTPTPADEPKILENTGVLGEMSIRMSLVDVLA